MRHFMRKSVLLMVVGAAVQFGAGCDDQPAPQTPPHPAAAASAGAEALPAGLVVAQAPAGARDVAEVRKAAADGEQVTLVGRIAGAAEPFAEGRAQFQLIDANVKSCREIEGDACPTPWDMCCEERDAIVENSVTVQVVGADGRPLKAGLRGVGGMEPLSEVSVKGTVRKSADGKAVTVDATEVYVKPQG